MEWNAEMAIIATNIGLVLTTMATTISLFIWNRAESRADIRHMDAKLEGQRNLMNAIHDEMKDFHNRLCEIDSSSRR